MDNELHALRQQLQCLGDDIRQRFEVLEQRIERLENHHSLVTRRDSVNAGPSESISSTANGHITGQPVQEPALGENGVNAPAEGATHHSAENKTGASRQSAYQTLKCLFGGMLEHRVVSSALSLFAPLAGLLDHVCSFYHHYQRQGKAPVFLMTAAGIATLVAGFAYLLQYSFATFLGPVSKVVLGIIVGCLTIAIGVALTRKRVDMAEYGSGIIALGVILNYLCAYFAGPYYGLLSDVASFVLLAVFTAVAYFLALRFETRVVAVVCLIGGALSPLLMGHIDRSAELYLTYLLLLSAAMLRLSSVIRWQPLAVLCMALCAVMVEISIINRVDSDTLPIALVIIVHGFFYLFAAYTLYGMSLTNAMTRQRLIIISSNMLCFLLVNQQLVVAESVLGAVYLLNVLPWLMVCFRQGNTLHYPVGSDAYKAVQAVALLYTGLLIGVGILVLSSPDLMGVIWCVESLLLIYLGSRFQFASVRGEGYCVLLLSLVMMGGQLGSWLLASVTEAPVLLALNVSAGWLNLLALTSLVYAVVCLLKRQGSVLKAYECQLIHVLDALLVVGVSLSFLLSVGIVWAEGMWLLAVLPMFFSLHRATSSRSVFMELFGLGHYALLFVPMWASAVMVGSFHFSQQTVYGQIARVEAFASLWFIAWYYKNFYPQSAYSQFAENVGKLFYVLIPVFFLPSVLRRYSDYFPVVLWLSAAVSLLLFYRLQLTVLKIEMRLLTALASVAAVYSCLIAEFAHWPGHAEAALITGVVFYGVILWWGKAFERQPLIVASRLTCYHALQPLFTLALYYFACVVLVFSYVLSGSVALGLLAPMVYLSVCILRASVLPPLRSTLRLAYGLLVSLLIVLVLVHVIVVLLAGSANSLQQGVAGAANGVGVFTLAWLVHRRNAGVRAIVGTGTKRLLNLWFFHLITAITYIALLAQLAGDMFGPVVSFSLVVHATVILFQTIKPQMKKLLGLCITLYSIAALKVIIWDMQDFSMLQKIAVLLLIGLCMLAAAFKYQKMSPAPLSAKR